MNQKLASDEKHEQEDEEGYEEPDEMQGQNQFVEDEEEEVESQPSKRQKTEDGTYSEQKNDEAFEDE